MYIFICEAKNQEGKTVSDKKHIFKYLGDDFEHQCVLKAEGLLEGSEIYFQKNCMKKARKCCHVFLLFLVIDKGGNIKMKKTAKKEVLPMRKVIISKKIKEFRLQNGLTQNQFATMLGISSQGVSKWEREECYPDISILPEIAEVIGCKIDDFFSE